MRTGLLAGHRWRYMLPFLNHTYAVFEIIRKREAQKFLTKTNLKRAATWRSDNGIPQAGVYQRGLEMASFPKKAHWTAKPRRQVVLRITRRMLSARRLQANWMHHAMLYRSDGELLQNNPVVEEMNEKIAHGALVYRQAITLISVCES